MFSVSILPSAQEEVRKAVEWYDTESLNTKTGDNFLDDLESAFDFLATNPYTLRIRYTSVRILRMGKRFPYFLHYIILNSTDTVIVIGVYHGKQDPKDWGKRLGDI